MKITGGRGVDVAIEALGTQGTFEACLRVLRPGGTLSSLGVYLKIRSPPALATIRSSRRYARWQGTDAPPHGHARIPAVGFQALATHRCKPDDIEAAYELFGHQRDGVLKVAITP